MRSTPAAPPTDAAGWRAVAVSALSTVNRDAPMLRWYEDLASRAGARARTAPRSRPSPCPRMPTPPTPAPPRPRCRTCCGCRVADAGQPPCAGWLLARDTAWEDAHRKLAARLALAYAHGASAIDGRARRRADWPRALRRIGLALAVVVALLAFIPVPLTTLAPVEVTPRDPFVVAAPVAGVVERILVEPGAQVRAGDAAGATGRHHAAQRFRGRAAEARGRPRAHAAAAAGLDGGQRRQARTGRRAVRGNRGAGRARLCAGHVRQVGHQGAAGRRGAVRRSARLGRPAGSGRRGDHARGRSGAGGVPAARAGGRRGQPARGRADQGLPRCGAAAAAGRHRGARRLQGRGRRGRRRELRRHGAADRCDAPPARLGLRGTARVYGEQVSLFFYLLRRPITALRQWTGL